MLANSMPCSATNSSGALASGPEQWTRAATDYMGKIDFALRREGVQCYHTEGEDI
jgi:hypothetical protein